MELLFLFGFLIFWINCNTLYAGESLLSVVAFSYRENGIYLNCKLIKVIFQTYYLRNACTWDKSITKGIEPARLLATWPSGTGPAV